jgi:hypothetical protein
VDEDDAIAALRAGLAERFARIERVDQGRLIAGDWEVVRALLVEEVERLEAALLTGELCDDEESLDRELGAHEATE